MIPPILIKIRMERPPEVAVRRWNEITRAGHEEEGRHWHQKMLPEHFKPYAKFKYRHRRRTRKYLDRKLKLAQAGKVLEGGQIDNVAKGAMRRAIQSTGVVRAFPSRVSIKMIGPRYMTFRSIADLDEETKKKIRAGRVGKGKFSGDQPDKPKELLTVTAPEEKKLAEVLGGSVERQLRELREPREQTFQ